MAPTKSTRLTLELHGEIVFGKRGDRPVLIQGIEGFEEGMRHLMQILTESSVQYSVSEILCAYFELIYDQEA